MSDVTTQEKATETTEVVTANPFDESSWRNESIVAESKNVEEPAIVEEKKEEPIVEEQKTEPTKEEIIDANEYLQKTLGFKSWDEAKAAFDEYNTLKQKGDTPQEIKFANDDSKRLFEALTSGKEDDIYEILSLKKQFKQIETLNVEDAKQAAQLLQLSYQFKYKDLSQREILDLFDEQYSKPDKPEKTFDQTDEEYQEQVVKWQARCEAIDRKIVRDAKITKPDVLKLKSEIVLPDIPKKQEEAPKVTEPTQEELQAALAFKNSYLQSATKSVAELKGFSTAVKDKDVELFTVGYNPSVEERAAIETTLKSFAEAGFNANHLLAQRWVNGDGTVNTNKMAEDFAFLDNKEKVLSKVANDAANQRLELYLKEKKKINVNETSQAGTFTPNNEQTEKERMAEHFFSN